MDLTFPRSRTSTTPTSLRSSPSYSARKIGRNPIRISKEESQLFAAKDRETDWKEETRGKREEVRLEEGRKEEEEEEDEEESSQRAPRTERVSSLAQGQALLLERERSNISGIGERKKRG